MVSKGKICEQGSHAELVGRSGGAYAALVRLQQSAPALDMSAGKAAILGEADIALTAHSSKQLVTQVRGA